jgi:hypothetical protein
MLVDTLLLVTGSRVAHPLNPNPPANNSCRVMHTKGTTAAVPHGLGAARSPPSPPLCQPLGVGCQPLIQSALAQRYRCLWPHGCWPLSVHPTGPECHSRHRLHTSTKPPGTAQHTSTGPLHTQQMPACIAAAPSTSRHSKGSNCGGATPNPTCPSDGQRGAAPKHTNPATEKQAPPGAARGCTNHKQHGLCRFALAAHTRRPCPQHSGGMHTLAEQEAQAQRSPGVSAGRVAEDGVPLQGRAPLPSHRWFWLDPHTPCSPLAMHFVLKGSWPGGRRRTQGTPAPGPAASCFRHAISTRGPGNGLAATY